MAFLRSERLARKGYVTLVLFTLTKIDEVCLWNKNKGKNVGKLGTLKLIILSLLGSLLGFASIATLFGVSNDEKLNKDYYKSRDETLFKK